jgi:hypothetical protein
MDQVVEGETAQDKETGQCSLPYKVPGDPILRLTVQDVRLRLLTDQVVERGIALD